MSPGNDFISMGSGCFRRESSSVSGSEERFQEYDNSFRRNGDVLGMRQRIF